MGYKEHAKYWQWDAYDRSGEFDFWCTLAQNYGDRVLSAMGAVGQAGAYMAQKGFCVTVLDYTNEMIQEGKKLYGGVKNLRFMQADITDFTVKIPFDFCFIGSADLHHLQSIAQVNKALQCLNKALKKGGGLALQLWLPQRESFQSEERIFEARKPAFTDRRVYKKGRTSFDSQSKKVEIRQRVFIEYNSGKKEDFEHNIDLQLYDKTDLLASFESNGFKFEKEYGDWRFNGYIEGNSDWFVLLTKQ